MFNDPLGGGDLTRQIYPPGEDGLETVFEYEHRYWPFAVDELYDPDDPAGSLYIRKRARLTQPDRDAWLYEYNRDVSGMSSIPSGDWKSHCRETRSAATNAT